MMDNPSQHQANPPSDDEAKRIASSSAMLATAGRRRVSISSPELATIGRSVEGRLNPTTTTDLTSSSSPSSGGRQVSFNSTPKPVVHDGQDDHHQDAGQTPDGSDESADAGADKIEQGDVPIETTNVTLHGVAGAIQAVGSSVIVDLKDSFTNFTESFRRGANLSWRKLDVADDLPKHHQFVQMADGTTRRVSAANAGMVRRSIAEELTPRKSVSPRAVPADAPCLDLTWEAVTVTAPNGEKVLLADASGSVRGHLLAIMGPSGCGKTTLLNYLACRPAKVSTKDSSKSKIAGSQYSRADLKRVSGYVMQTDLVNGRLTVEETLMYTAHLRLPTTLTNEEKRQRVNTALEQVGLSHVRNTIVGDPLNKGISGGERKRLCVAMELLLQPRLLFLDEPTAGLDSVTALKVMQVLKDIAVSGACTVLCTLSQPQSKIFALFDDLILMCNGRIAYNGPAQDAVKAFAERGYPCPPNTNPADHLIDVLIQDTAIDSMCKKIRYDGYEDPKAHPPLPSNFHRQPWANQFLILFGRTWTDVTRNRLLLWTQLIQTVVMAILVGATFLNVGATPASLTKRRAALFFFVVNQGMFGALMMINSFPAERILVIRERYAGTYYVSSYFMSKLAADIPNIVTPAIFSCIVYWMVGLHRDPARFFIFLVFMVLCCLCATSVAMMISALCRTATLSVTVLPMVLEVFRLFGGYFLAPVDIPVYFQWLSWMSYCKYVYIGVVLNDFKGLSLQCTSAEAEINSGRCPTTEPTLTRLGLNDYSVGGCIGSLCLIIFISRVITYFALRFLK